MSVTSPAGHSFHFMPVHEKGITDVTVTIAWPMPWPYEADKNPSVPYIGSQALLSGGTPDLSGQEVLELFNDTNTFGQINVTADHAYGELSFPIEHKDKVVPVAAYMLAHPVFDPKWVDRAKQDLRAGLQQNLAQSSTRMWQAARLATLGPSPLYHFLSMDDLSQIDKATAQDLAEWHRKTFVQTGATIVVTGAIPEQDAGQVVDQLLSDLPRGPAQTALKTAVEYTPKTVLLHLPDAQKTTLGLFGQLPATTDGKDILDLLALQAFNRVDGPLFSAIRTDLRASYGLQAGYDNFNRENRLLFISGEVDTEKLAESVAVVRKTYEAYRTHPDWTGFDAMRASLEAGTRDAMGHVDVAARSILQAALDGLDPDLAIKMPDAIAATSSNDVADRMRADYPAGDQLIVFAVSPDASALPGACVITRIEQVLTCP